MEFEIYIKRCKPGLETHSLHVAIAYEDINSSLYVCVYECVNVLRAQARKETCNRKQSFCSSVQRTIGFVGTASLCYVEDIISEQLSLGFYNVLLPFPDLPFMWGLQYRYLIVVALLIVIYFLYFDHLWISLITSIAERGILFHELLELHISMNTRMNT